MPFKYPFTIFKGSFFGAFLKQMYTVSNFCKDPRPTSHKLSDKSYRLGAFFRKQDVLSERGILLTQQI